MRGREARPVKALIGLTSSVRSSARRQERITKDSTPARAGMPTGQTLSDAALAIRPYDHEPGSATSRCGAQPCNAPGQIAFRRQPSTTTPASPAARSSPTRRRRPRPRSGYVPSVLHRLRDHRRAGPDRQRRLLHTPGAICRRQPRSRTNAPAPTGRRPTDRSNASTGRCWTSGLTPALPIRAGTTRRLPGPAAHLQSTTADTPR
jgi:hypothetical protein